MRNDGSICPSDEDLDRLLRGDAAADRAGGWESHVGECAACRARLDARAALDRSELGVDALRRHATPSSSGAVDDAAERGAADGAVEDAVEDAADNAADDAVDDVLARLAPGPSGALGSLGPYEVLRVVARGGMAVVLEAREPALERRVAVKVLAPALAASSSARSRFLREARAAAAIVHENVLVIHAVESGAELPYIVMPLIDGETLDARLRREGGLPPSDVIAIGLAVARALAAAHARGLIHRDVKPGNILLERGGKALLADFGLARAGEDPALTRSGFIAGTPQFMSPEQAEGRPLDHRTDLFSLGAVLYAALAGRGPFDGGTLIAVLRRVVEESPLPLAEVAAGAPPRLVALIEGLLEKDAAARPASAAAVAAELEALAAGGSVAAAPRPRARRRRRRAIIAALAAALAASLAIVAMRSRRPPPDPDPSPAPLAAVDRPAARITIVGDGRGFDTLEAAIAASRSGVTILIPAGEWNVEAVAIAGKALVLRGDGAVRPVLRYQGYERAWLTTDAPLAIEDLDVRQEVAREGGPRSRRGLVMDFVTSSELPPLVRSDAAPLLLRGCRLEKVATARRAPQSLVALSVRDCPRLAILDTEIYNISRRGIAVLLSRIDAAAAGTASRVTIDNCLMVSRGAIGIAGDGELPIELEVARSTFVGRSALFLDEARRPARIAAAAAYCAFDVSGMIHLQDVDGAAFRDTVSWSGRSNIFSVREPMVSGVVEYPTAAASTPQDLVAAWMSFWDGSESAPLATDLGREPDYAGRESVAFFAGPAGMAPRATDRGTYALPAALLAGEHADCGFRERPRDRLDAWRREILGQPTSE